MADNNWLNYVEFKKVMGDAFPEGIRMREFGTFIRDIGMIMLVLIKIKAVEVNWTFDEQLNKNFWDGSTYRILVDEMPSAKTINEIYKTCIENINEFQILMEPTGWDTLNDRK